MNLIELAREMGKQIQESQTYKNLDAARTTNDEDQNLQDLIANFNLKRVELSTSMAAEKKDDEKIAKLDGELKQIYKEVMENENMNNFNNAKQEMDKMMNKVTTILMKSVNGEDPMTCAEEEVSCGGSCSTCGGCN